jgi:hypothetical protein
MGEVWTPRWVAPFESAFNLLQKYAWANVLDIRKLRKHVLPTNQSGIARLWSSDLLRGEWIGRTRLPASLEAAVRNGLLGNYAKRWTRLIASGSHLRYCLPCAEVGYHSIFHQVDGLTLCPIHTQRILDSCQRCEAPMPAFNLRSSMLTAPFRCPQCQEPLASKLDPNRWVYGPSDQEWFTRALAPIADWLHRLSKFGPPDERLGAPLSQLALRGPYAGYGEHCVSFQIARRITPLEISADTSGELRRPLRLIRVRTRINHERMTAHTAAPYLRRCVAKSIRRYISKTYIRDHRRCVEKALQEQDIVWDCGGYGNRVLQNAPTCPVAGAYLRWFSLYEKCGPFRRTLSEKQHMLLASPPPAKDANLVLWAWRVLADFYSSAATALQMELSAAAVSSGALTRSQQREEIEDYCHEHSQHACWIVGREEPDGLDTEFIVVLGHEKIVQALYETAGSGRQCRRAIEESLYDRRPSEKTLP